MSNEVSTASEEICECCKKLKLCRLYLLPLLDDTAWICKDCRRAS